MKKLLLVASLISLTGITNAQENMMSKRGTPILPEKDDWSIGFDAVPVLQYFGNVFNGNTSNNGAIDYQNQFTLVGKMMKDSMTAYRAKVRIGFSSTSQDAFIADQTSTTSPPLNVTDTRDNSDMNIVLGAGIQKYRGKGRLKGFYGAEAMIGFANRSTTYSYGNAIDLNHTDASLNSTDFGTPTSSSNIVGANRVKEDKSGSDFGFAIRGFIGVEYFFAPKMSIGTEYGWGLGISSTGEGSTTIEGWDATANATAVTTAKSGGSSDFGIDVDNTGFPKAISNLNSFVSSGDAVLYLSFYF